MTSVTWEESEAYLFWIVRTMTNVLSTVIVVEGYANYNNSFVFGYVLSSIRTIVP